MELRTEGLLLRPWRFEDAPALTAACQDPEIGRWISVIPSPYTEEDSYSFIGQARENWDRGECYNFAIVDAESGDLAGSIAVRMMRFNTGHVGYWIARESRGRGAATEALTALCGWAVETLDVKRLELLTDVDNEGSQRVAQKAGFQREGILRSALAHRDGTRRDSVIFSLLPQELS
jgi:RimJ/RimL family protein N-acetyltransferase